MIFIAMNIVQYDYAWYHVIYAIFSTSYLEHCNKKEKFKTVTVNGDRSMENY